MRYALTQIDFEKRSVNHVVRSEIQGVFAEHTALETASIFRKYGNLFPVFYKIPNGANPQRILLFAQNGKTTLGRLKTPLMPAFLTLECSTTARGTYRFK